MKVAMIPAKTCEFMFAAGQVIKIWNARNLSCLQTLSEKLPQKPDELISVMHFDAINRQLIMGSDKLAAWPVCIVAKPFVFRGATEPVRSFTKPSDMLSLAVMMQE